jgi:hypothetical protein
MKREDRTTPENKDFTEAEAWSRFERAVDGAAKHGPLREAKAGQQPKRVRTGANKRRTSV